MADRNIGLFKIGVETDTSSFENISRTLDKFIKKTAIEKKIRLEVDQQSLKDVNKYLRVIENSFTGLDPNVLGDWFADQMQKIADSDSIDIAVGRYEQLIRVLEKFGHINVDIEGLDQVKDVKVFEAFLKDFIGNYESYQKKLDKIVKEANKSTNGLSLSNKIIGFWDQDKDGVQKQKTNLSNLIEYISLYETYAKKLRDISDNFNNLSVLTPRQLEDAKTLGADIEKVLSSDEVVGAFGDLPKLIQKAIAKSLESGSIINPYESILENYKKGIKRSVDSIYGEQLLTVPMDVQLEMKKESYDNIVDRAAEAVKQAFKGDDIELQKEVPIELNLVPKLDSKFKDQLQERLDESTITGEVFVKPKLTGTFEKDLQTALDERANNAETTAKVGIETVTNDEDKTEKADNTTKVDSKLTKNFRDTTQKQIDDLDPNTVKVTAGDLSSDFQSKLQTKIDDSDVEAKVPIAPKELADGFQNTLQGLVDQANITAEIPVKEKDADKEETQFEKEIDPYDNYRTSKRIYEISDAIKELKESISSANYAIEDMLGGGNNKELLSFINTLNSFDASGFDTFFRTISSLYDLNFDENDNRIGTGWIGKYGELTKVVQDVIDAIGRKNDAFNEEETVVDSVVFKENQHLWTLCERLTDVIIRIEAVTSAFKELDVVIPDLSKNLKLPSGFKKGTYDEVATAMASLRDAVKDFDNVAFERFASDVELLNSLKISTTVPKNLRALGEAVKQVNEDLNSLSALKDGSSSFISNLEVLLNRSEELQNLASILKTAKLSDIATVTKSNSKNANDKVIRAYKDLISAKRELLQLQKDYNKAADAESKKRLSDSINEQQDNISSLEVNLKNSLDANGVTGNFASFESQLDKCNQDLLAFSQRLEDIRKNNEQVSAAISRDSADWGTALSILTSSDKFKTAVHEGKIYYDLLQDIQSIDRTLRTDNLTGASYLSYKFTDSKGNSITTGLNGDLEIERKKVLDLAEANKQLKKARVEAEKVQITGNRNELTDKLEQQLAEFDSKYANFKPKTKEEAEGYQALANAIAETVLQLQLKRKEDESTKASANNTIYEKTKELKAATEELVVAETELYNKLKSGDSDYAQEAQRVEDCREKIDELRASIAEVKGEYDVNPSSGGIGASISANLDQAKELEKKIDTFREIQVVTRELINDTGNWGDVLQNELGQSEAEATALLSRLGEIQKMTKTTKTDSLSGKQTSEYNITGSRGKVTIGSSGNILKEQTYAENLTAQYKAIQNAVKLVADEETKAGQNRKALSAAQQAQLLVLKNTIQEIRDLEGVNKTSLSLDKDINGSSAKYKQLAGDIEGVTSAYKNLANGSTQASVNKFLNKVYQWMNENSKGANIFKEELTELINTVNTLGPYANIKALDEQFLNMANSIEAANLQGKTFGDRMKDQIVNSAAGLVTTYLSVQDIIRYVKEAVTTIEDLDYALVDLSKTADMTESQLEGFYHSANDTAKAMGVTTQEVIEMASSWSRLGYSTAEAATEMAELTAKFAAISPGMTTEEANTGLISIMKAWQEIDVDDVEREILDKVNVLGNKFAEENSDILDGAQKFAAALSTMGTSYEDAFALFTGAQEVIQDADRVGNGLKTVAMRIRGYTEDVESGEYVIDESLSNISGDLYDLTKIGENGEGISIYTDATKNEIDVAKREYKSLVDYFRELSQNWNEYSETQQTELLQKLFGKTQSDIWLYVQKCA